MAIPFRRRQRPRPAQPIAFPIVTTLPGINAADYHPAQILQATRIAWTTQRPLLLLEPPRGDA
jgi:hypothetical protein